MLPEVDVAVQIQQAVGRRRVRAGPGLTSHHMDVDTLSPQLGYLVAHEGLAQHRVMVCDRGDATMNAAHRDTHRAQLCSATPAG